MSRRPWQEIAEKAFVVARQEPSTIIPELEKRNGQVAQSFSAIRGMDINIKLGPPPPPRAAPIPIPFRIIEVTKSEIMRLCALELFRRVPPTRLCSFPILKRRNCASGCQLQASQCRHDPWCLPYSIVMGRIKAHPKEQVLWPAGLRDVLPAAQIKQESIPLTSFIVPMGQYEYPRILFRLINAPRVFQRAMHEILKDMPFIKVFLNDIFIISSSKEEHAQQPKQVLDRL